jgi:hypothetical protein
VGCIGGRIEVEIEVGTEGRIYVGIEGEIEGIV